VDRNQVIVGQELNNCEEELILVMNCGPEPNNCGPEPPVPPCSAWFRSSTIKFLDILYFVENLSQKMS
jgi:hypothetical protein